MSEREKRELDELLFGFDSAEQRAPDFQAWLKETTPTWTWDWEYQVLIQGQLARMTRREIDRLMLFVPPRHGKSEMVTVRYPGYRIELEPSTRFICGAYSQFLANKFSRKTRRILTGRVPFAPDARSVDDWETIEGGGGRYAGVGAGVTGAGGDLIGIDDPVKNRKEANSAAYRESVWDWYKDDLMTRLEPGGQMFLIMTRWHHDDLAGRILMSEEARDWVVITLPALAEENDPLGRPEGAALCPARYDEKALLRRKRIMGETFLALFQQRPTAAEGNIFKRHTFRYFEEPAPEYVRVVQSWDTAYKPGQLNDPSVCTTWGQTRHVHQLRHVLRKRLEYPALKKAVIDQADDWEPDAILIEDKASGQSLIQDLRNETQLPIVAIEPEGDKLTRAAVEAVWYEAGKVEHPRRAMWLPDFEAELLQFDAAPHDDQVDSTTQYLAWAKRNLAGFTFESTGRRESLGAFADEATQISAETSVGRVRNNRYEGY